MIIKDMIRLGEYMLDPNQIAWVDYTYLHYDDPSIIIYFNGGTHLDLRGVENINKFEAVISFNKK